MPGSGFRISEVEILRIRSFLRSYIYILHSVIMCLFWGEVLQLIYIYRLEDLFLFSVDVRCVSYVLFWGV